MKRYIIFSIFAILAATVFMRLIVSMNNKVIDQMVVTKVASFVGDKGRMPNSWIEFNQSIWGKDFSLDDIKFMEERLSLAWGLNVKSVINETDLVFRRKDKATEVDANLSDALRRQVSGREAERGDVGIEPR